MRLNCDQLRERERCHRAAREKLAATQALRRVWVGAAGHACRLEIGIALAEVFYTSNPWTNVQYIADRLCGAYSTDTIRRRLEEMVDANCTEVIEVGGRKLYRACLDAAEGTIAVIMGNSAAPSTARRAA
ncbi:hypothetical protein NOVOSPHI9U_10176 [Novosphingobium sp. 9U]|nr:hypothetical protein NOVOSPHI9U_10176 [Novosphingobium sp. 9U]